MRLSWWKILGIALLLFTHIGGLLLPVARLNIVNESIRSLYFHVPMWFTMILLFLVSAIFAVMYLLTSSPKHDLISVEFANVGIVFGILGIVTGMIWANYTWGSPWHGDPKQNGAAVSLLVYMAYFILRSSLDSVEQRSRLSAVYNIFAFAAMIPLLFILPRLTDSMHPGNGGNPGFNTYDLDNRMRLVFYPAVAGWILLGVWMVSLRVRFRQAEEKILDFEYEKNR